MRRLIFAVALLASTEVEARARTDFCGAVAALVSEALRTGEAQRPFVGQDEPFTFACGHRRGNPVQRAFCAAARDAVGLEFLHGFPWEVYDCLRMRGIEPDIQTTDHYTGVTDRGRLIHLAARWPEGATLEIRYTPFEDDLPPDDPISGYRGRYDVTVARTR